MSKEDLFMPSYGSTDQVRRTAARLYIYPARQRGEQRAIIHSGTLNKELVAARVIDPNRLPLVCNALRSRKFLNENGLILESAQGPPSGISSTVTFVYRLEEGVNKPVTPNNSSEMFHELRGILKNTYKKLGGSDTFHRREREALDRDLKRRAGK
jgi:hypothetical protein